MITTGTNANNTMNGSGTADRIFGLGGNDKLNGLGGNDTLDGGTGNDTLDGGAGNDRLVGGTGNDVYIVTATSGTDTIVEAAGAGGGDDTVRSSRTAYTLANNVENLILLAGAVTGVGNGSANTITGNSANNTLDGRGGADDLLGGGGNDKLLGGDGNDHLDGQTGNDDMQGGAGDDTYVVDSRGDLTTELAPNGTDTVIAHVDWSLDAHIENLILGVGAGDLNGSGNAEANFIQGNTGDNTLDGRGGNDEIEGGAGEDVLVGRSGEDTLDGGAGNDVLLGGASNDVMIYDADDDNVNGGSGQGDTLLVQGDEVTVDLIGTDDGQFRNIEIVDLGEDSGTDNTLRVNAADVIAISTTTDTLRVDGAAGDVVESEEDWTFVGTDTIEGNTYNVYVSDEDSSATLQIDDDIEFNDLNHAPVIETEDTVGEVTEDSEDPLDDSGLITFDDADAHDVHTATVTADAGNTIGGTLVADVEVPATGPATGTVSWTYSVDNDDLDVQALSANETATETFTVTIDDGQEDGSASSVITVTLTGANDTPDGIDDIANVVEAGSASALTSDADAIGNVLANDSDVDSDAALTVTQVNGSDTNVGASQEGTYGSVIIDAGGNYTYTLDDGDDDTDALSEGETVIDSFTYTVEDQYGASSSAVLNVTVTGANDQPVAMDDENTPGGSGDAVLEAGDDEAGDDTAEGNVLFNDSDVDNDTTLSVSEVNGESSLVGAAVTGTYGSVIINADSTGSYTYTLDNADVDTDALAEGQTATETFTYTVSDGQGGTDSATLTITVTGSNDAPVANADNAGPVFEDNGNETVASNVLDNDTDVDSADSVVTVTAVADGTVNADTTGTYGSVNISSDGDYTYTVDDSDADTNALSEGQVATDTFTYTVTDDFGATSTSTLTVTVVGNNDGPEAVADENSAGAVIEAGEGESGDASDGGNVLTNDSDVDNGHVLHVEEVNGASGNVGIGVVGTYGNIVINEDGSWNYELHDEYAATNALSEGTLAEDVFTYTVQDEFGASSTTTLTVTVTGQNDTAELTVPGDQTVAEDTDLSITGISIDDPDTGAEINVTLSVNDGTIDVNDTASGGVSVSGDNTGTVVLTGSADDINDILSSTDGVVYTGDQDFNGNDTLTVTVDENDGSDVVDTVGISVTPVNDAPDAIDDSNDVVEAGSGTTPTGTATATGNVLLNDTDVDSADADVTVTDVAGGGTGVSIVGNYGSVTIATDGSYVYTLDDGNADTDELSEGQVATDTFTYTVTDDGGLTDTAVLTISVTGNNDAPVAVDDTAGGVLEAGVSSTAQATATGDVLANDTDVDADANVTVSAGGGTGAYGSLTLNADGSYVYTLNDADSDTNALSEGQAVTDTFTYTVSDGQGGTDSATLTVNITGNNDAPVAAADTASGVIEAGVSSTAQATATGNVLTNDTDVDTLDANVTVTGGSGTGTYGGVVINADGSYVYTLNDADSDTNALSEGQAATDTFTYTISDGEGTSSAVLTVNITGNNDAPVAAADTASGVIEAGVSSTAQATATGNVLTNDTDVDTADANVTVTGGSGAGTYGSVVINADGSYVYTLNDADSDTNALSEGQAVTDTFTYTISDGEGTSSAVLTVNITGNNDAPVAVADTASGVIEAGVSSTAQATATGNVLTNDTDVDTLDANVTVTGGSGTGTYGGVVINADGSYVYTLNDADSDTNALSEGQAATDTFTYTISDGEGTSSAVLTVNITGNNDAPVAAADTASGVIEAGVSSTAQATATGNVLTNDTDVDTLDANVTVTGGSGTGTYGGVVINADGSYVYTLNDADSDTNALSEGQAATDTFTYTISDGEGTSSAVLTVNITGNNDAPVAAADTASGVIEAGVSSTAQATATGNVLTNDTDVDTLDANVTVTGGSGAGTYGSVVISADGSYVYTLDNNDSDTNALSEGQAVTDTFTYTISDGEGTSSAVLTVNITGNNDAPVAAADTASGVIEAGVSSTAQATATGNVLTNDTDVDTADANVTVTGGSGAGTYGSVVISADGSYVYTLDNNDSDTNALSEGQAATDTFTYTISDGEGTSSAVLTVNITGNNDAPDAINDAFGGVAESGTATATGNVLTNDTDVDTADANVTVTGGGGTGTYGSVTINADGSFVYTLSNADSDTNALSEGQAASDTFAYTISDGEGTDTAVLTINITGDNDAPDGVDDVVMVQDDDSTAEYPVTGNVLANDSDADAGTSFTVTEVNGSGANVGATLTGDFTTVTIDSDGSYTYSVDENGTTVDSLGAGETAAESYTYTVEDESGASSSAVLTITVTGNNDAPAGTDNTTGVDVAAGNETYVFTTADFGFTDPTDTNDDNFLSVIIDTDGITGGTLYLAGVAVTDGQEIGVDSIAGGELTFVQEDSLGGALTDFDFQVRDDGGTANGGVNLDGSANVMNINLLNGDFVGTAGQDVYTALAAETIYGLGDDDDLEGSSSADNIFGGTGGDQIKGAGGSDNIDVGNDAVSDTVSIEETGDGVDFITGFIAANDFYRLEGTIAGLLDDITVDGAINFGSGADVDLTVFEGVLETGSTVNLGTLGDVAGEFDVVSVNGDDALLVLQSSGSTGIYYYLEGNANSTVDAGELTPLAVVSGALLASGNFNTDAV